MKKFVARGVLLVVLSAGSAACTPNEFQSWMTAQPRQDAPVSYPVACEHVWPDGHTGC